MNYNDMTNEAIAARLSELSIILEGNPCSDAWDVAYKEYNNLVAITDERYRQQNQEEFDDFYNKHIKGKTWEEINPDAWQCYSDWHKDMYGFRPKSW